MSEKKWKIDSRVPHKYRGGRRGKGSEFPRRGMNEYEGERLSMGNHHFSKHKTMSYNKSYGWASLHIKYLDGSSTNTSTDRLMYGSGVLYKENSL